MKCAKTTLYKLRVIKIKLDFKKNHFLLLCMLEDSTCRSVMVGSSKVVHMKFYSVIQSSFVGL